LVRSTGFGDRSDRHGILGGGLSLLVCDIGADLRHVLGAVAICCFSSLVLLVSTMFAFKVGRQFSLRLRNQMSRRGLR
jgi:hypothetical protein